MENNNKCSVQIQVAPHLVPLYELGYTLSEASEIVGCSRIHLDRVLSGERTPSKKLSERLKNLPAKTLVLRRHKNRIYDEHNNREAR